MKTHQHQRTISKRGAFFSLLAAFGLLAGYSVSIDAQEPVKIKDAGVVKELAKEKEKVGAEDIHGRRGSIEISGFTRPGNPDDAFTEDGKMKEAAFTDAKMAKFKIMGGTVYFVVFKNTGLIEGDTFNTGLANFDSRFETGRSHRDTMSPGIDRKAKYLYLYQIVNDRNLDPRVTHVGGATGKDNVRFGIFDPKLDATTKLPVTEDIASFSLKLLVDPRYITSWGHFRDSGFAAEVADIDPTGKVIRNVVDDGKGNKGLAFSHAPAIVSKLTKTTYSSRARSYSLGDLQSGLGVRNSTHNLTHTTTHKDLVKTVAGQKGKGDVKWIAFAEKLIKSADAGKEPEFVQLMYMSQEERAALNQGGQLSNAETIDDEITRAIFRVDFSRGAGLKQGEHSVVFGFTTDLPPVNAPVRIDTPGAAVVSEGLRLANYFGEGTGRGTGTGTGTGVGAGGGGIVPVAGVGASAALALASGSGLGVAATPAPAGGGDPGTGGFAGIGGSFGGGLGGGGQGGGFGGGVGFPSLSGGGFTRAAGQSGGGGIGGGTGSGQGTPTQTQDQNATPSINFEATLVNIQAQLQAQAQFQNQSQHQHQKNHDGNGGGHVVPAPASLLLGLLGLPGLYFLRRRKDDAVMEA